MAGLAATIALAGLLVAQAVGQTPTYELILRVLLAAGLGGVVGMEREHRGQYAGFRTQMLVAVGAAMAMVVSLHFADVFGSVPAEQSIRVDPARVAYGVMAGVGFLGAMAVLRSGRDVRGVTTAASLWCSAAIGLACGFGMYYVALAATGIVLVILTGLKFLDAWVSSRVVKTVTFVMPLTDRSRLAECRDYLLAHGVTIRTASVERNPDAQKEIARFVISLPSRNALYELAAAPDLPSAHVNIR